MKYIFNIDMVGNPAKDENPWHDCKFFTDFLAENPLPNDLKGVDLRLYNVRRDTFKGSVHALLKYELPEGEPVLDIPTLRMALEDVKREFVMMEGKGKIRVPGEITINPDGSSGVVYKAMGLDTRQDVLVEEPGMLQWFNEWAHIVKYPILWKEFGKVELLKVAKGIRGISNPPVDFHMASAAMNQHTNELASEIGNTIVDQAFGPGMTLQGGGLNRYINWLNGIEGLMASSDADRWDAGLRRIWFQLIKELRFFFWDKKGMSESEWWERQNYYYDQKIFSYLLSSNGQVFLKMFGNPSGQDSTTYDNTWAHILMKFYIFRIVTGIKADPSGYVIMKRHYRMKCYGDDNNEKVKPPYDVHYTYEKRAAAYAELGITLAKSKDVESRDPTGHVWLGKTIRFDYEAQAWVGEVNSNKTLCSLLHLESSDLEPEIVFLRTVALMVEATWTEPLQSYIRSYALWLHERIIKHSIDAGLHDKWFVSVPTHEMCKNFWLGRESSAPGVNESINHAIHVLERLNDQQNYV